MNGLPQSTNLIRRDGVISHAFSLAALSTAQSDATAPRMPGDSSGRQQAMAIFLPHDDLLAGTICYGNSSIANLSYIIDSVTSAKVVMF